VPLPAVTPITGASSASDWPVALVSMPFVSSRRPSIQLGLLKAIARQHGYPASSFHFGIDLAARLGQSRYEPFCQIRRHLTGDWLFSVEAFNGRAPDPAGKMISLLEVDAADHLDGLGTSSDLRALRNEVLPAWLDELVESEPWGDYRVVGFTTTFQQTVASLALAERLKARWPGLVVVFGGANCDGEMGRELARSATCVDYVVIGEADESFPALLDALRTGVDPLESVAGLACHRDGALRTTEAAPLTHALDDLPVPVYDDFFERAERFELLAHGERHTVRLPFESARGCWWGAKHHCTFCGLNGSTITYRSKSPARVKEELGELVQRYGTFRLDAVDNIINMQFFNELLPDIQADRADYELFYEIKANLKRDHVKRLRLAGVRRVQPGIESLSTPALKLMRKGISAIQNVNFLRWAEYYGVQPIWNVIWGFPTEDPSWPASQAALMPLLHHLRPPRTAGRIWLERFSPLFVDREAFPAQWIRPAVSYQYIYPSDVNLEKLAYMFDYELDNCLPDEAYADLSRATTEWMASWSSSPTPWMKFWSAPKSLRIEDARDLNNPGSYTFEQPLAAIYAACSDEPKTPERVRTELDLPESVTDVTSALQRFVDEGLMMCDDGRYLSLALPANPWR